MDMHGFTLVYIYIYIYIYIFGKSSAPRSCKDCRHAGHELDAKDAQAEKKRSARVRHPKGDLPIRALGKGTIEGASGHISTSFDGFATELPFAMHSSAVCTGAHTTHEDSR